VDLIQAVQAAQAIRATQAGKFPNFHYSWRNSVFLTK